jgi:sarcosine oxidase subunit alpha
MNGHASRRGSRLAPGTLRFAFDGRDYLARAGDTAASALLANGVRAMGRSVKYRRIRGLIAAGPEEPNALLTVGIRPAIIPNVAAPQLVLRDGLILRSQNRWPTLRYDLASVLQAGGGFFSAGFQYKTFMWPSWKTYESMIRALAGLGEAPGACDLPPVAVEHISCDVLIGGAGPAGLAAARAAARAGARVVVCEREPVCGGELEFESATIDGAPAAHWVDATLTELRARDVRLLRQSAIVGGSDGLLIAHSEPDGLPGANTVYRIRPTAFVMAGGAVERPIAFIDNDLPGVMLLGAGERYLARFGVRVGSELVLFANHDRVYAAAARFLAAGVRVHAIIDPRSEREIDAAADCPGRARAELVRAGVVCLPGHAVIRAQGARGGVRAALVAPLGAPDAVRSLTCDALLVSGGWTPAIHAGLQDGGLPAGSSDISASAAVDRSGWRQLAGAANDELELAAVLAQGHRAGERAARLAGASAPAGPVPRGSGDPAPRLVPFWRSPAARGAEKRQFVDFQNDVTVADLRQALDEGFLDIEHVKRYTTLGVGTEQGRTGSLLGAAIVAEIQGLDVSGVGTSRLRPPYQPVTLRSLAGHRVGHALRVTRRTPLNEWHAAHGGRLESMGLWMRPRYYAANGGDAFTAGITEAARVRTRGGIADGSTLGKIEVAGPDAPAFLDRMYLTKASTIKVGRGKYMINLREDGMVLDDGIVLRLEEHRFLATTSSGHAQHLLSHFEHYRDTEWADRRVIVADVTEAWAVIVVAGPDSRDTLQSVLGAEWRDSLERLAHMEFAHRCWRERDLRVLRASFSGELAFELHCRPGIALPLWQALVDSGLAPYGLEAVDILRVEKGYLAGFEMNGQTTPHDLGLSGLVKAGGRCVGSELLDRPAFHEPARPRLVGLRAADGRARFLPGAQLTMPDDPVHACGFVTSAVYSPALGQWIGLALAARALAADGTLLVARDPLRVGNTAVRIVPPVHFDPGAERIKA